MASLTVRDLRSLLEKCDEELNLALTHTDHESTLRDLIRDVQGQRVLINHVVGVSHMGCALDAEILTDNDEDMELTRDQRVRTLRFPKEFVPYINWDGLGAERRTLACGLHATQESDGAVTVVLQWDRRSDRRRS